MEYKVSPKISPQISSQVSSSLNSDLNLSFIWRMGKLLGQLNLNCYYRQKYNWLGWEVDDLLQMRRYCHTGGKLCSNCKGLLICHNPSLGL